MSRPNADEIRSLLNELLSDKTESIKHSISGELEKSFAEMNGSTGMDEMVPWGVHKFIESIRMLKIVTDGSKPFVSRESEIIEKIVSYSAGSAPARPNGSESKAARVLKFIYGHPGTTRDDVLSHLGLDPKNKKEVARLSILMSPLHNNGLVERKEYKLTDAGISVVEGKTTAKLYENRRRADSGGGKSLPSRMSVYFQQYTNQELTFRQVRENFKDFSTAYVRIEFAKFAHGEENRKIPGYEIKKSGHGRVKIIKTIVPGEKHEAAVASAPVIKPVIKPLTVVAATPVSNVVPETRAAPVRRDTVQYRAVLSKVSDMYREDENLYSSIKDVTGFHDIILKARNVLAFNGTNPDTISGFYCALKLISTYGENRGGVYTDFLRLTQGAPAKAGEFVRWVLSQNGLGLRQFDSELGKYVAIRNRTYLPQLKE